MRQINTPRQQMAAGFWVTCGVVIAIGVVILLYQTGTGKANPHTSYFPMVSKAPTAEAKREFRAWSVSGLLHYHYERECTALKKLPAEFVGRGIALGDPKRQAFDGLEMDPCPLCVQRR
jgi:hypothetical protein